MKRITQQNGVRTYVTVQGDMWDSIAYRIYGDERRADELQAANEPYSGVYLFQSGVRLLVPEIPARQTVPLPPWRKGK